MTREEAIEKVRQMSLPKETMEILEALAPELRESEEERIRKDIIGGLMWQRDNLKSEDPHDNNLILPGFCFTVGKHLAYLEKQKEEEGYEAIPVESTLEYKLGFKAGKESEKQKEQMEIPLMNGDADLYFDTWIQHNDTTKRGCFEEGIRYAQRLQKEQKPAECIPDSVKFDEGFKTGREVGFREGVESVKAAELTPLATLLSNYLKNDFEYFATKKWDEKKWNEVMDIQASELLRTAKNELEQEQKPAWSEEDEKMLRTIISDGSRCVELDSKQITWLKSLRPSWKPSEEDKEMKLKILKYLSTRCSVEQFEEVEEWLNNKLK